MTERNTFDIENAYLASVYQKFPVCMTRGKGAILYDADDKEYIDCMGGYGVSLIGHCHPKVVRAIREQSEHLITCHSSFYNDKRAELLEKLSKILPKGLERLFLSNSGSESVECALKVAAKFTGKKEVIAMVRGYHGKTFGALSATWNPKYRDAFQAFLNPNFKFVPFGKLEKVQEAITPETAAVIVEPVQGESGIYVCPDGYLRSLRELCDQQNIVLIFDEVQTGFGRTGRMWASEHWNIVPDIMCVAKAMGGGLPIGATITREDIMEALKVGEHSSTFGGNPLACAAACATIDAIIEEDLVKRARILGENFKGILQNMVAEFKVLREVRGLGLMIGLESRIDIYNVLTKTLERGVILLYSGKNIIRFLPPLVIEMSQLEKAAEVLEQTIREEQIKVLSH